jgi:predicted MFS family arabinose efflux permease
MRGILAPLAQTLAIQATVSMVVFTPPVLAPVAAPALGIAASGVGIATSLMYVAAAFAALSSGGFIARFGPMRTSQLCLLLVGIGVAMMAAAWVPLAALGALVIGLGYGAVTPSSSVILNERTPEGWRSLVFSLKQTGVPVGGALAGALIPPAMDALGCRGAALAAGCACVAVLAAVQPARRVADRTRNPRAPFGGLRIAGPLRLVWSHAPLRELGLASFAYSGMQMCLGSFLVVFLDEAVGYSVAAAGAALSVAMGGGIVGRIAWGIAADRTLAPRAVLGGLGVAMSACAVATAAMGSGWPLAGVLALSAAFGATAVGWNGVYLAEVARIAPHGRAADATGGCLFLTYIGVFVTPIAFWAVVASGLGYAVAFGGMAVLCLWRGALFFGRPASRGVRA